MFVPMQESKMQILLVLAAFGLQCFTVHAGSHHTADGRMVPDIDEVIKNRPPVPKSHEEFQGHFRKHRKKAREELEKTKEKKEQEGGKKEQEGGEATKEDEVEKWPETEHHGKIHWLNDKTFFDYQAKTERFITFFYAPWCPHSKHLKPVWGEVSEEMHEEFPLTAVNCMKEHKVCGKLKIHGFPHLQYFSFAGDEMGKELRLPKEDRTKEQIIKFLRQVIHEQSDEYKEKVEKSRIAQEKGKAAAREALRQHNERREQERQERRAAREAERQARGGAADEL
eukprot:g31146.t1